MASLTAEAVFRSRLQEARKRAPLTGREFADLLAEKGYPLGQPTVTKIENGTRGVSLDDAIAISAVLGVSPMNMFTPLDDRTKVALTPTIVRSAAAVRAWVRGFGPLDKGQAATVRYLTESPIEATPPNYYQEQLERERGVTALLEAQLQAANARIDLLTERAVYSDRLGRLEGREEMLAEVRAHLETTITEGEASS